MNRAKHLGITLAVVISLFLTFSQTAYAYIDAGTGSIIIQVLIGSLVAASAMIGVYRMRVKNFLGNIFKRRRGGEEKE